MTYVSTQLQQRINNNFNDSEHILSQVSPYVKSFLALDEHMKKVVVLVNIQSIRIQTVLLREMIELNQKQCSH